MGCKKAYKWYTIGHGDKGISANFDQAIEQISINLLIPEEELYINGFNEYVGESNCTVTRIPVPESVNRYEEYPPLLAIIQVVVIPEMEV